MQLKRLARPFEVKAVAEDGTFSGYGSVFGVRDSYGDVVEPGAFAKSLEGWAAKGRAPAMLWQHDASSPIGVWTSVEEDGHGLKVAGRILLEAGAVEQRAYAHLKAGSVSGLSIGYVPEVEAFDKATNTNRLRQIALWEISPVTFPANEAAQVDVVKAAIAAGPRDFERFLRDAGLSHRAAKALMSGGFLALRGLRDADGDAESQAIDRALGALRARRG